MMNKIIGTLKYIASKKSFSTRTFSSVLYITGDKAHKTYMVLTPVIDFEKQLENSDLLKRNLEARKIPIDLEKVIKRWHYFQSVDDRKKILELTRAEIARLISELMTDAEKNKNEIETLKLHSKLVKDDLKNVKDYSYGLEEDTMLQILSLPNVLHEKTPSEPVTLYKYLDCITEKTDCHLQIGKINGYLEYINPFTCYFKSEAALFEMGILNFCRQNLLQSDFNQFSNPNFCRSIIAEGCGDEYEHNSNIFTMEEPDESASGLNHLHLCGSATLYPFMAYFARNLIPQTCLPLKYFSVGKKYQPVKDTATSDLFNLSQQSAISIFVATTEEDDHFEELKKLVINLYEQMGYHFKLILLPAHHLEKSECLRMSIQIYSNFLENYIEVGNISLYDSYLSKRLLFTYNVNKEPKYPRIISGTLLNVPRLLGCVLENNDVGKNELMTDLIKRHLFA